MPPSPPRRRSRRPQPVVPEVNLAFLPHFVDLLGAGPLNTVGPKLFAAIQALLETLSIPNIFAPPSGFLTKTGVVPDNRLQEIVNRRVLTNRELAGLRFSLVDLTDPQPNPGKSKVRITNIQGRTFQPEITGVAGKDVTKQGGLGSMAKLACMWAAFQLRFDVQTIEGVARTNSAEKLFDQGGICRRFWDVQQVPDTSNVTTLHARNPLIQLQGSLIVKDGKPISIPDSANYPDLFRTLGVAEDSSGVAAISFLGSALMPVLPPASRASTPSPGVRNYMRRNPNNLTAVRKLTFWEKLLLMIDASDDAASHGCIENVGFLYIGSLLWQSGLFSPDRNGGLWEGDTHDKKVFWTKAPVPQGDSGNDHVTGTAAAVAALMTALAQDRLTNRDACDGMRFLTDVLRSGRFLGSFFFDGLLSQGIRLDRCHAKVGVANRFNDVALIERTVLDRTGVPVGKIRYVAAGFDAPDPGPLHRLIVQLDKCIQEFNGLIDQTSP